LFVLSNSRKRELKSFATSRFRAEAETRPELPAEGHLDKAARLFRSVSPCAERGSQHSISDAPVASTLDDLSSGIEAYLAVAQNT
jgi:hypothetical protein